jgi:GrpB-like predicted nucleotidyltransferase (UPF0157 family)
MADQADQPIELAAYEPAWQRRFAEQQARLTAVLKPWLAGEVEHIGSTSVPGLRSKPIVDLLAPVRSLQAAYSAATILEKDGWLFWAADPNRHYRLGSCGQIQPRALITSISSNKVIQIFWL